MFNKDTEKSANSQAIRRFSCTLLKRIVQGDKKRSVPRLPTQRAAIANAACRDCQRSVPRLPTQHAVFS